MSSNVITWNFKQLLLDEIKKNGGWVNAHVHADRAFTINPDKLEIYEKYTLEEKWDIVDEVKVNATEEDYYRRISQAIELMISQGVTAVGSFIDVDPVCEDRAIKAAMRAREHYKDQITIKYINQVLKGVIEPEARKWFDIGAEYVDIIGGLPRRDERDYGLGAKHIDILLETAKRLNKMVHVHVDQFNYKGDRETELLCYKTIEHGMQGKVVAIHGISIAAERKEYREYVYELLKKAGVMIVACPTAWLDSKRNETLVPFHNSLTPADELVSYGIPVGIGTDNIADYMVPFCDGDMWSELRLLTVGTRFMQKLVGKDSKKINQIQELVNIATTNGRKTLGIINNIFAEQPFYDPLLSYEDNFEKGPFGAFANNEIIIDINEPQNNFLGEKVNVPFGIPAGPLVNGKFVKAALDKGFDLVTYKTVRTKQYPCHPWPNVVGIKLEGDLTIERAKVPLVATASYSSPLSITNSFGVPSYDPDYWQKDLSDSVKYAKEGQIVIGSFQGTPKGNGNIKAYIRDFVKAAQLVKETGAKILEANLSCPNEGTAHLLCFDLERTNEIAHAIKQKIGNTPLILKIAYFSDQEQLTKLVKFVGGIVQGLAVINTIPAAIVDEHGNQALPGKGRLYSGVCGHAIRWAGLDMVKRIKLLREELDMDFSIIGVGGVTVPEDYNEYIHAGADAVMSATGAMWNPYLALDIKRYLSVTIEVIDKKIMKNTNGKRRKKENFSQAAGLASLIPR